MMTTLEKMRIEASWHKQLQDVIASETVVNLKNFLEEEKRKGIEVYPPDESVFQAFSCTPYDKVKVVIVGQDPYHGPKQAHGLSFSVLDPVPPPPSLKNIYKELVGDVGIEMPTTGCLLPWAKQGVLLLNAILTVRKGSPLSHQGKGWEFFTDKVIEKLADREEPIVFLLWGKSAQEKALKILNNKQTPHAVLTAPHPSPYSANNGFFGCKHFSKANECLKKWGKEPIDWRLK